MAEIFKSFLLTSLAGVLLTLILIFLKPLTKKAFSAKWHYYIWIVVFVVMMCPLKIDMPMPEKPVAVVENIQDISLEDTEGLIIIPEIELDIVPAKAPVEKEGASYLQEANGFLNGQIDVIAAIWVVGAVIMFAVKAAGYTAFIIKMRKYSRIISCPEISEYTSRKIVVRESEKNCSPIMIGIIRPTLILPETDITNEQLHNILAHEITHLKRNDILYKWAVTIVKCVHWFNPFVYLIGRQINTECEISCDLAVVDNMDAERTKSYINTILSLLTYSNSKNVPLTTGMTGNKKVLKRRFMMIKNKKKVSKATKIVSIILAAVLLVVTLVASGIFASGILAENQNVEFICNGKTIEFVNKPFCENGAVYLPLQELFEKVGAMDNENSVIEIDNEKIFVSIIKEDTVSSVAGDRTMQLNYCYSMEIGKAQYILNPEEKFTEKSIPQTIAQNLNTVIKMSRAPVLKSGAIYVPYEYIDAMLEKNMSGLGPHGVDGPYNFTCIVNGENPVAYISPCLFWPAENDIYNSISREFGETHNGVDTVAKEGSGVVSAIRGKVTETGFDTELGNYVVVENDSGVSTLYAHLASVGVAEGQDVYKRENIGTVGKTGMATGAFLHFEIKIKDKYYDPMIFWAEQDVTNAENMSYQDILELQNSVNNGHFPWRLDYKQVIMAYVSGKGENVEFGELISFAGDAEKASATYQIGNKMYVLDLFKPIDKSEHGIWVIRTCKEASTDAIIYPVQ